eukprot:7975161-Heterocapsa_arctica.AAC.1
MAKAIDSFNDDLKRARKIAMARALVKMADYVICTRAEYWRKMATDKGGHFGKLGVAKVVQALFQKVPGLRVKNTPG